LKDFSGKFADKIKNRLFVEKYIVSKSLVFYEIITKKYGTVTEAKEIVVHLNNTTTRTLFAC